MRKNFFLFPFQNFFGFCAKFFQTFGQNPQEVVTTTFCVSRLTIWDLKFFLKFWIVLHFLQKPLAWSSKFYLRVQSKICGRNKFFYSSFLNFFRILSEIFFRLLARKRQKICHNYLLRVQRNNLWLEFFLIFESFRIFCRNHWHGSQNSIYVSRVKIAEEINFFILPFWIFPDFERNFFLTSGQKIQKIVKTTFCVCRGTICGLKFF